MSLLFMNLTLLSVVRFKNMGDPLTMLRSVNPREAALVDAASGTRTQSLKK